ncbi:DUF4238 domain-containing protein [Neorhizobium galegae]|nr:DUF4238 domain-containing protein [Neorhizobium galegae]
MTTRGQHYVSRHYLQSWATDEQIYCLRAGSIFQTNVKNVAKERDFYKLKALAAEDILFLKHLIGQASPAGQRNHWNLVSQFDVPSRIEKYIRESRIDDPEVLKMANDLIIEFEENYHQKIEDRFINYQRALREGDASFFLNDSDAIEFIHALCVQFMRTKAIRQKSSDASSSAGLPSMERVWGLPATYLQPTSARHYIYRGGI